MDRLNMKSLLPDKFDARAAGTLVVINALIVLGINIDSPNYGMQAGLVQAPLSFLVVGYVMPQIRRMANEASAWRAYGLGAVVIPAAAMLFTQSVHWWFATPNFFWTAVYLFFATVVACTLLVLVKRHIHKIRDKRMRALVQRL